MVDRRALRAEIEETRIRYHELLRSLSDADWKQRSANPAWTISQLMWHIARGAEFVPGAAERLKKDRGINPPQFISNPINVLNTRWGARKATPTSVAEKYDAAHIEVLLALDRVKDEDWGHGAMNFGRYETVEFLFHTIKTHFDEHERDILIGLGRRA